MRLGLRDILVEEIEAALAGWSDWLGHPPTGRRFERIDEVSIVRLTDGRIVEAWGIEDNMAHIEQLGLR